MTEGGPLLLGVDGGGTKTLALVADASGSVLGAGRAGSSDIHAPAGPAAGLAEVVSAVSAALDAAGVAAADLASCAFCLCGADWPEDDAYYAAGLTERLGLAAPLVANDAFGGLRAGTHDGIGVALVMGTGATIAARGPEGRTWFSGERMESAAASASELGRLVFDLLIRGEYGPGPRPSFERAALEAFGAASVEELVHAVSRVGGPGRRGLGALAPVFLEASHRGDPSAQAIVAQQGRLLAGYVRAAAQRVGLGEGSVVVLSGGLLRHEGTDLADAIIADLADFSVERSAVEPVYGAVLMAADAFGLSLDPAPLLASGPAATFFETR
jgi:N-acetylglucosamine kinase-like BadF-type ATPase